MSLDVAWGGGVSGWLLWFCVWWGVKREGRLEQVEGVLEMVEGRLR